MKDHQVRALAEYNRKEMEARIKRLVYTARGTNLSISPYIRTGNGVFSQKKADAFIKELLKNAGKLTRKERQFYATFFYCTFRCFANESIIRYDIYERVACCETFQDILDKAKLADADSNIASEDVLHNIEYRGIEEDPVPEEIPAYSFFITMDLCYQLISGNDYKKLDEEGFKKFFDGQIYKQYEDDMADEVAALEKRVAKEKEIFAKERGFDSYDECEKALKKLGYKDMYDWIERAHYENMSDEDLQREYEEQEEFDDTQRYIKRLNSVRKPQWERFKSEFEDPEEFFERYKQYRRLFFEVDHRNFYRKIEKMVYGFLYENGLSIFTDDDATFSEFYLLEDLEAKMNASLERIRRKNGLYKQG